MAEGLPAGAAPSAPATGDARSPGAADREAFSPASAATAGGWRLDERDAWVILLGVPGLGPVTFEALLGAFGSARAVLEAASAPAGAARLREAVVAGAAAGAVGEAEAAPARTGREGRAPSLPAGLAERICDAAGTGSRALDQVRSLGLAVVTLDDPAYPARLRRVEMPPPLLFVRGSAGALGPAHSVAVVGTRRPTDRGRLTAAWIASGLVRAGAAVVSGLAVGIDGAAHAAAVGESGLTVAVLGSGHARLFPRAHERLADAIVDAGGAVVSEHPPETAASRGTFPRRNRVVSGLADAVVVVEAGTRSGALITAGWALEQGRECYLVPGAIDSPASAGCNAFLRAFPGEARVVCGVPELIEDLGLVGAAGDGGGAGADPAARSPRLAPRPGSAAPGPAASAALAALGPVERLVAGLLAAGPVTVDELAARGELAGAAVLGALTLLELRGLAKPSYGRYLPAGALARGPAFERGTDER